MRRRGVLRDGEQLCMTAIQGSCMLACVWEIRLEKQEELSSSATSTSKLFPTSGSLYLMFPLPRPLFMATSVSCFRQHKCHLLRKAFSDIRTQSKHLGYFFNNNFMFIQSIIILLTWWLSLCFPHQNINSMKVQAISLWFITISPHLARQHRAWYVISTQ